MKCRISFVFFFLAALFFPSFSFSLDREAFSITKYDLDLQIDQDQARLGVRGKVTLRNDSPSPLKIIVLQVSSSLSWKSIRLKSGSESKPVQFITQPLTTDIDHTGSLSEAIVTLPQAVAPKETLELEVGYEGAVPVDTTRLTRIGVPDDTARNSEWDRIDPEFIAIRGAGHVAWYPICTNAANMAEGSDLQDALTRWRNREAGTTMHLNIGLNRFSETAHVPEIMFGGVSCSWSVMESMGAVQRMLGECSQQPSRRDTPTLVIAQYKIIEAPEVEIHYLPNQEGVAQQFAAAAKEVEPVISQWFGPRRERAKFAALPEADDDPFESGALLFSPLAGQQGLSLAHQLTHASFLSFRPWIEEGLAHFAQALYLEHEKGRQHALDYLAAHRQALLKLEEGLATQDENSRAMASTTNDELYRSKAMSVWWMLRDMIGDSELKKAIAEYRPEQDQDVTYMPRLIAAHTQRELDWFFEDWVYHDRGLPDFKIESVFPRKTDTGTFIVTTTVDNLGTAGAEVPVTVKFAGGEVTKRLEVRSKTKGVIRIEIPKPVQEVAVNDGSVPETGVSNNVFKVQTTDK